jgi:hypothetical protein
MRLGLLTKFLQAVMQLRHEVIDPACLALSDGVISNLYQSIG